MNEQESACAGSLDPDFKSKWLAALRSGDYAQGRLRLRGVDIPDQYCCLGVAGDLLVREGETQWEGPEGGEFLLAGPEPEDTRAVRLPESLRQKIGLSYGDQSELMNRNDFGGSSFARIADWIEENL